MKRDDGMLLYHGSYTEVKTIDLGKCKGGLDFGKAFYVTTDPAQAMNYVPSAVKKAIRMKVVQPDFDTNDGRMTIYRYHADPGLRIHYFPEADIEWLHFVAANRDNILFPDLMRKFDKEDIICGRVANDQTARTLQAYLAGAYGVPGERQADETAIRILLPNRLSDQIAARTPEAVKTLEFIRSVRYGDRKSEGY